MKPAKTLIGCKTTQWKIFVPRRGLPRSVHPSLPREPVRTVCHRERSDQPWREAAHARRCRCRTGTLHATPFVSSPTNAHLSSYHGHQTFAPTSSTSRTSAPARIKSMQKSSCSLEFMHACTRFGTPVRDRLLTSAPISNSSFKHALCRLVGSVKQ